ncbi:beta-ketoacyl synthase N-terminal-like domain-containing protein [Oleidesulfovibrio sp.]|uniref:type I polyketide synthase n=1 Tax=Oleidesulfovibrio sp. TaxID=2909707 RepID=UPI003A841493
MSADNKWEKEKYMNAVAVVGMAGRFSQADALDQLWTNLKNGVEVVRPLSPKILDQAGCPSHIREHPNFVPMTAQMEDVGYFDATFFGYTPAEARTMDPQLRLMLETSWHAFENAGYAPRPECGLAAVYAGAQFSLYWPCNVQPDFSDNQCLNYLQPALLNGQDFLSTWISYKLGLNGPSLNVQTACSTGLVVVATACQNLLDHSCDMALAVAGSVSSPRNWGYIAEPQSILSPTGHCRPFDAKACGTISGEGVGAILLKRLGDAIADGDSIQAVIRGCGVNNDGAARPGYSSPSIKGQKAVIRTAYSVAGICSSEIQYVEAHGTGTSLGDPIEFIALQSVFGEKNRSTPCVLGSVKANYGHLGAAAGMLSLIKVILTLKNAIFTPQINYNTPNPDLFLDKSAFRIFTQTTPWHSESPRIAAVSSFGFGGTNCHAVVEEWPAEITTQRKHHTSGNHCIYLSAASRDSLDSLCRKWSDYLQANAGAVLRDISTQSLNSRKHLSWRTGAWGNTAKQLAESLKKATSALPLKPVSKTAKNLVAVFSGQGSQYPGMVNELHDKDADFRTTLDRCGQLIEKYAGENLVRQALCPDVTKEKLKHTHVIQPVLFSIGYALCETLKAKGIKPNAVMGHSLGEYTAACVAGVFSLEDAVRLTCARGQLMAALPGGDMLAVAAGRDALLPYLQGVPSAPNEPFLTIAACNAPEQTVVSGSCDMIKKLRTVLTNKAIRCTRLDVSHAFHSPLMQPMITAFSSELEKTRFHLPKIPLISNVTGKPEAKLLTSSQYWLDHTLNPVLFSQGLVHAAKEGENVFIEIGPRPVLESPALQTLATLDTPFTWLPLLDDPTRQVHTDSQAIALCLIELYKRGITPVPTTPSGPRLSLPLYPFAKEHHWLDMAKAGYSDNKACTPAPQTAVELENKEDMSLLETLAAIWTSILGIDGLSEDDDFFALGGTSIAAIRILTTIKNIMGITISLSEFSNMRTLRALEMHVEFQLRQQDKDASAPFSAS